MLTPKSKQMDLFNMKTDPKDLQNSLWEAANTLRGSAVDRTDWKGYILPLLFFKRISDVWDEERKEALEIYGQEDPIRFEEVHRFQLPPGCHWNDIRGKSVNVGSALKNAMQEIELANPSTLSRVFGSADWGNRENLSDEKALRKTRHTAQSFTKHDARPRA